MSESGGGVENPEPEQELKSIITLYIVSHGIDMPNSPFNDPSVRILSQAGKFGCWGFLNNIEMRQITWWIKILEITSSLDPNKSTYSMLEQIKTLLKKESNRQMGMFDYNYYLDEADKTQFSEKKEKTIRYRQSKHTGKTIEEKEDWQIYTPVIDHLYDFTDKKHPNQGIFIVDMKNKPASCKFMVYDDLLEIMNQTKDELHLKEEFKQMKITDFLLKHKIFVDEETTINMANILYENEFRSLNLFILSLNDVHTTKDLASILGIEAVNKIHKILREEYLDLEYRSNVKFSELAKFLKDAGFDIINIIDRSCRAYGEIMSKEEFAKINAKEDEASLLIDRTLGGKKRRKITRKTKRKITRKKRRNSRRKSRISK